MTLLATRGRPSFCGFHQIRESDFERVSQLKEIGQTRIPLAALDAADVSSVEVSCICQSLLGQPGGCSERSERLPEGGMAGRSRRSHGRLHGRRLP